MKKSIHQVFISILLVMIQFICLAALFITGPLITLRPLFLIIEIIGILILFWAVSVMRTSKLNVFPDVRKGAIFISRGPYKFIRHPMYLAVILFSTAIVLGSLNPLRLLILIVLIATLVYKIEFEEKLLIQNFENYSEYCKTTKKLVPFIY
jgi:protein-S-isoprenylcysteine O-methyltransferase Ste14